MDIVEEYRKKIKAILKDYVSIPYSQGDIILNPITKKYFQLKARN